MPVQLLSGLYLFWQPFFSLLGLELESFARIDVGALLFFILNLPLRAGNTLPVFHCIYFFTVNRIGEFFSYILTNVQIFLIEYFSKCVKVRFSARFTAHVRAVSSVIVYTFLHTASRFLCLAAMTWHEEQSILRMNGTTCDEVDSGVCD